MLNSMGFQLGDSSLAFFLARVIFTANITYTIEATWRLLRNSYFFSSSLLVTTRNVAHFFASVFLLALVEDKKVDEYKKSS